MSETAKSALQVLREKRELSREKLAALAGCSSQTIYNLENGTTPRLDTARAIADALGVHPDDVFPRVDNTEPEAVNL
jgi:DNA-binding XRE family transcriptional regulator